MPLLASKNESRHCICRLQNCILGLLNPQKSAFALPASKIESRHCICQLQKLLKAPAQYSHELKSASSLLTSLQMLKSAFRLPTFHCTVLEHRFHTKVGNHPEVGNATIDFLIHSLKLFQKVLEKIWNKII